MKKTITQRFLALSVLALLFGIGGTSFYDISGDVNPHYVFKTDGDYH